VKGRKRLGKGLDEVSHLFLTSQRKGEWASRIQAQADPQTVERLFPRVVAVTGDHRGLEKSFLVSNLAVELARQGHQVSIVDADLSFPDQTFLWGLRPRDSVMRLATAEETDQNLQVILQGPLGVKLLSLDIAFSRLMALPELARQRLLAGLRAFEIEAQLMVVDTPPNLDRNTRLIFQRAHLIAVLVPSNTLGMIDAYAVIKRILTLRPMAPVGMVIYNVRMASEAAAIAQKITKVVKEFLGASIVNLGFLYADLNIAKSIAQREPLILSATRSKAAGCLRRIAENIWNREKGDAERVASSFFAAMEQTLEERP
jgi:flagellar biosynthesis protein FlhG